MQLQLKSTYPVDKRENYSSNKSFLAPALGTLMCTCYEYKKNIFPICLEQKRSFFVVLLCVGGGGGATVGRKMEKYYFWEFFRPAVFT